MKFAIVAAVIATASAVPSVYNHGAILAGPAVVAHAAPVVAAVHAPAGLGGNGFGFGGHFSPMPQPALVPVPAPYPVDAPYTVPVDKPYAAPYVAKVVQPVVHKQTVVSQHVAAVGHVAHH